MAFIAAHCRENMVVSMSWRVYTDLWCCICKLVEAPGTRVADVLRSLNCIVQALLLPCRWQTSTYWRLLSAFEELVQHEMKYLWSQLGLNIECARLDGAQEGDGEGKIRWGGHHPRPWSSPGLVRWQCSQKVRSNPVSNGLGVEGELPASRLPQALSFLCRSVVCQPPGVLTGPTLPPCWSKKLLF